MHFGIDEKTWKRAVKALKITKPIRAARKLPNGSIEFRTAWHTHVWKPPKPRKKSEPGSTKKAPKEAPKQTPKQSEPGSTKK